MATQFYFDWFDTPPRHTIKMRTQPAQMRTQPAIRL